MSLSPAEWSSVQTTLKGMVGEADFNSWLLSLRLEESDAGDENNGERVALSVPTPFMQDWIDRHYGAAIRSSFSQTLKRPVEITYVVSPTLAGVQPVKKLASFGSEPVTAAAVTDAAAPEISRLDPRFTFETFVTGKSNDFAYAAAQRIAESDDHVYNPFFLHGVVGLGKTHLMHAIGHRIREKFPQRRVLYISSDQFLRQFVRALREKNTLKFKESFQNVDVLMIDDIQFIAGKNATQEEFFHTFNFLVGAGKQVILTADRSPHELENIEDRLRSRLGSGLTCEIHAPDVETRLAILQKKAESMRLDLPENVAMFLADGIASNVRELEGALNRLAAHAQLYGADMTIDFAQEQLRDLFRANIRTVTLEDIQRKVAEYFDVRLAELLGSRRLRAIARPRQVAMYLAKRLTSKSYPDIGRAFGGRDHTTVIHAVRTIENLLSREADLNEKVQLLEKILTTR
jgi:chromosomal replication initiator protein